MVTMTCHFQMMEVARILSEKANSGEWRPRRTIVFASWGAEEYSLIGSWEFTEDHLPLLEERAVAYLNVDICVTGEILNAQASPTIKHKLIEASKVVENPQDRTESYFDFWQRWNLNETTGLPIEPSEPEGVPKLMNPGIVEVMIGGKKSD